MLACTRERPVEQASQRPMDPAQPAICIRLLHLRPPAGPACRSRSWAPGWRRPTSAGRATAGRRAGTGRDMRGRQGWEADWLWLAALPLRRRRRSFVVLIWQGGKVFGGSLQRNRCWSKTNQRLTTETNRLSTGTRHVHHHSALINVMLLSHHHMPSADVMSSSSSVVFTPSQNAPLIF